jgi:glycosyltransferase involved in cell wall biosynthesis
MLRKKILWLVSWYPNKNDSFDGDFIQRHARAAAIDNDVHVIFVTDREIKKDVEEEWNYAKGLTEQIIYFKKNTGFFSSIKKQWKWKNLFQDAVKNYIEKNDLPHCVHVHVPWKAGLVALWMKRKFKTSFIISEHWGIYNKTIADNFYTKSSLTQKLLQEIYKEARSFVTVSEFLADGVERTVGKKHDLVIPNVVDTSLFFPNEEKYSKFTFIHVSNMAPLKNAGLILKAFKKLILNTDKELQLIMIGNRNKEYVKLAAELDLLNTSVFFRGEIVYTEVAEEMRRSHCFVLFSDSETFSCVTAEALCSGLPVLASNVGALPELINERNGILVVPKSIEQLNEAMNEVLENYSSFDKKNIAAESSKQYGYSTVAKKFDELYKNC